MGFQLIKTILVVIYKLISGKMELAKSKLASGEFTLKENNASARGSGSGKQFVLVCRAASSSGLKTRGPCWVRL